MNTKNCFTKSMIIALICGILGCICFGWTDWTMIYGDTSHSGKICWLTEGASSIEPWKNALSMAVTFPGIILFGIAFFRIEGFILNDKRRKKYLHLTAFGLAPWLCLHLYYVMILFGFAWLNNNGYAGTAAPLSEALINQFSWVVYLCEGMMLPQFIYWLYMVASGETILPKTMVVSNPLVIYALLYAITSFIPYTSFRMGLTNGLLSESIMIWLLSLLIFVINKRKHNKSVE